LSSLIDTDDFSARLRSRAIDVPARRLLITDFRNTEQEEDLTLPPNCGGYGRIRHFRRATSPGWPENPLPIDPAQRALGVVGAALGIRAQVFQNAACNWRCWYCYVPFELLSASSTKSAWLSADELIDRFLAEPDRASMIDLTGGQPDLVPEWIPWTMEALQNRGIDQTVYLWSDDNLSNDYHTRFLSEAVREKIASYPLYGRVCCFKGFDSESFSFNTQAAPELFDRQFALFRQLLAEGIDLYAYATFTAVNAKGIADSMARFVDRLQEIDENLPLRTVPLEIQEYTPLLDRMKDAHHAAMKTQWAACDAWQREVQARFRTSERTLPICEVKLGKRRR
jgi:uncharacterized Fe-S cluster-containing radical SAM superfamily protein